ncbi:MAG TPA: DUF3105 domain-containing protein [Capillimicrobium sp.]|nr:DUF3105 domain-containing protein [Capillimicrobium sp.]
MSSRQEEKERRRREREEQEAKAAAAASRSRRLQIAGGALLAIAVVVVAVVLITSGGGGDDAETVDSSENVEVTLPPRQIENLQEAADAAGCTYRQMPNEGSTHVNKKVEYKSNPPTSGDHNPVPAEDGVYSPGNSPAPENYVHSLEHGRIIFQYKPGASERTIATLEAIFNEEVNGTPGYHALVLQNNTGMKAAVAATAWDQMLTCPELNDEAIDAFRAFRERFTDKGPEFVP